MKDIFLALRCGVGVVSDVLTRNNMFLDIEMVARHGGIVVVMSNVKDRSLRKSSGRHL